MAPATGVSQPPLSQNGTTAAVGHPLDPLTAGELGHVVRILTEGGRRGEGVRIASINLIEPEKHAVEALRPGDQLERKALAVLVARADQAACEVVVDLRRHAVASATGLPSGIQPSIMLDEFAECEQAVRTHGGSIFTQQGASACGFFGASSLALSALLASERLLARWQALQAQQAGADWPAIT